MLLKPDTGMLSVHGTEGDKLIVQDRKIVTSNSTDLAVNEVESISYDDSSGVLTLTLYNGQTVTCKGFPTVNNIPAGDQGAQGDAGPDGRDGRDGRDGDAGAAGCTGAQGEVGETGPAGRDGRQGPDGNPGIRGLKGERGDRGEIGATGPTGATGATGATGGTGPTGATGPTGPVGKVNIIVSAVEPTNAPVSTIWVNPTIGDNVSW